MPELTPDLKNRVSRHLGYSRPRGVQPALLAIFNQHCESILSNNDIYATTGQSVINLLQRCDNAFRSTDFTDEAAFTQYQQILGDINRSTRTLTIDDVISKAREMYLICCDDLALFLNVPNLQRKEIRRQWIASIGDTYLQVTPSVPDSCVSDRILLNRSFA